jgi:Cu-processing system ATP-binding protein
MIEVRGLTKRFGAFLAVDDVSFEARAGEVLALVGPNGSGKSTTMKCIAGLISPTHGEILANGAPIAGQKRDWLSYLPQKVSFPENLTGKEVIGFYSRLRKLDPKSREHALEVSQLNGFSNRAVREYSAGMLQRLGIAVAIMPETSVVVLDEPTAGLDPDAVSRFRALVLAMRARGQTVLLSSHALTEVEAVADRVAILVRGRLAACESIRHFRDRLAQHAVMRITLREVRTEFVELVSRAGVGSAEIIGSDLVVTASAANRLELLRTLESGGADIEKFSTEDPSLESLYLRYTRENTGNATGASAAGSLRI